MTVFTLLDLTVYILKEGLVFDGVEHIGPIVANIYSDTTCFFCF